ncbi:homocysteine-responsive endoplasmic reticulum-resident ubiquitin-like domain member 2 protein isoform X2 [Cololabis saira]|uniref:homocysteine-responsive endoplasmic reticulum-resident ubiquitin-like domain member 2 protein isoform X2 n=1 Tax=Cololabis saira TaxID=129043 RepID=UPI002AD51452|nr:homocysteine-responsive endoplasmic reticulum-resident ubiquitin-like domain member 2 protein isoform X2 [Cololabis saira]
MCLGSRMSIICSIWSAPLELLPALQNQPVTAVTSLRREPVPRWVNPTPFTAFHHRHITFHHLPCCNLHLPQETPQNSSNSGQDGPSSPGENSEGLRQRVGPFPYNQPYPQFMQNWTQFSQSALPTNMPAYYNPMTLMWWQQQYARQYYMHYYLLAAAAQNLRPDQTGSPSNPSDPLSRRPQGGRHGNPEVQMNAQGGEILNEEELNRDWLDWVYIFSRAAILLSIVYFYSSFSRFVMVMMAMLVLYLHQAGWFPFNLENELQLPGDQANQDDLEGELQNQDFHEMEGVNEDTSDEDGDSGEEGVEDPNSAPQAGFFSSTWSFIITFFMSLIPEGPPNAAN